MSLTTRMLLGGFLTMAAVMGVGRFYYTPLLPLMQRDAGFGPDVAGLIASANFAGYLAGSILATLVPRGRRRVQVFRVGVALSIATTLAMGFTDSIPLWLVLRTLSGVASAFAMILAAGMTAEALAAAGQERRVGWIFAGVGFGITLSGILVRLTSRFLDASELWIAAGLVALALSPLIFSGVGEKELPRRAPRGGSQSRRTPRPLPFWPLFVNYTCEGLGYSVFATFIVAIVRARPGLEALADWVWVLAGVAGMASILIWTELAERIGYALALALAYGAQIVGVLLPALSSSGWLALVAAVLFGGTFMAITVLTLPLGRHGLGGRGFAVLTAGFGLGQMLGPVIAGYLVVGRAGYETALLGSAAVLALGTAALIGAMARRSRTTA